MSDLSSTEQRLYDAVSNVATAQVAAILNHRVISDESVKEAIRLNFDKDLAETSGVHTSDREQILCLLLEGRCEGRLDDTFLWDSLMAVTLLGWDRACKVILSSPIIAENKTNLMSVAGYAAIFVPAAHDVYDVNLARHAFGVDDKKIGHAGHRKILELVQKALIARLTSWQAPVPRLARGRVQPSRQQACPSDG